MTAPQVQPGPPPRFNAGVRIRLLAWFRQRRRRNEIHRLTGFTEKH